MKIYGFNPFVYQDDRQSFVMGSNWSSAMLALQLREGSFLLVLKKLSCLTAVVMVLNSCWKHVWKAIYLTSPENQDAISWTDEKNNEFLRS